MSDSRENKTNCFPRDLTLSVYNSRFSNVITSVTPKPKRQSFKTGTEIIDENLRQTKSR